MRDASPRDRLILFCQRESRAVPQDTKPLPRTRINMAACIIRLHEWWKSNVFGRASSRGCQLSVAINVRVLSWQADLGSRVLLYASFKLKEVLARSVVKHAPFMRNQN